MKPSITLGRLVGVDIGRHYSWFIIALLITLSLVGHFGATNPNWSPAVVWTSAVVTAVLFFVSIVLHELSHALVHARAASLYARSRSSRSVASPRWRTLRRTPKPSSGSSPPD